MVAGSLCAQRACDEGVEIETLLRYFLQGSNVLLGIVGNRSPMVPHNVVFVHLVAGIVGQSVCIQLGQANIVFLFKMPRLALGKSRFLKWDSLKAAP